MYRHILECSDCGMSLHISEGVCEFCGRHLSVDKVRHVIRYNIPYLSLFILVLLVFEIFLPLNHAQERVVFLADEFILAVFILDISLDKNIYRGQLMNFFRRRTVDMLFVLPFFKTFRAFEAVPSLGKTFRGLHAVQHVPLMESRLFSDALKAGHIAKYAKYAYPALKK